MTKTLTEFTFEDKLDVLYEELKTIAESFKQNYEIYFKCDSGKMQIEQKFASLLKNKQNSGEMGSMYFDESGSIYKTVYHNLRLINTDKYQKTEPYKDFSNTGYYTEYFVFHTKNLLGQDTLYIPDAYKSKCKNRYIFLLKTYNIERECFEKSN